MRSYIPSTALMVVVFTLLAGSDPASAATINGGWHGTDLIVQTQTTSQGDQEFRYHVLSTMWADNGVTRQTIATKLRLQVRLVPSGWAPTVAYPWQKNSFPVFANLGSGLNYSHQIGAYTQWVSCDTGGWYLDIQFVWDRRFPSGDVVHEVKNAITTPSCDGLSTAVGGV